MILYSQLNNATDSASGSAQAFDLMPINKYNSIDYFSHDSSDVEESAKQR